VLVSSPTDPKALYLGTQYVMKTLDGGLHWETISPDITGSIQSQGNGKAQGPPTVTNAKQRGYGIVSTIAPFPLRSDLIWAGTNTGLIHLTTDGGKTWKNVTPQGVGDWSEISLIEPSHFDPAVAYAAVDRSRLDDQTPYIYRTRDYGASWQLVTHGIPAPAFLRAVREDPETKGLLFAGTELGVYVSFDDGDRWQSLQLNLPAISVRDLTIHGDDLVIATHGRSFWILDNITPLRQAPEASRASRTWLFRPAAATRIDNDAFVGTPLPPEEPTAENPPNGAMIDYFIASPAKETSLEIFDAQQNLIRKFSSEEQVRKKHAPVPVADHWLPNPEIPPKTAGMHRYVWDLTCGSSGEPIADEESDLYHPSGPKVVPGTYQVRLTIDGQSWTQSLKVIMDPRSPATPAILAQQFELAKQIFAETMDARRALAEIGSVQKQLTDAEQTSAAQNTEFKLALMEAQSSLSKIITNKTRSPEQGLGLLNAYQNLATVLRVVEGGDRQVPAQATAVYQESSQQVQKCIQEWAAFKQSQLPEINRKLRRANLATICD
jgi:photosystem II stability/assembly factor-like uncharacterized protein